MTAVSAWVKLALDIAWAWVSLSLMRSIYKPPGSYWVYVNRTTQVRQPPADLAPTAYSSLTIPFDTVFSYRHYSPQG